MYRQPKISGTLSDRYASVFNPLILSPSAPRLIPWNYSPLRKKGKLGSKPLASQLREPVRDQGGKPRSTQTQPGDRREKRRRGKAAGLNYRETPRPGRVLGTFGALVLVLPVAFFAAGEQEGRDALSCGQKTDAKAGALSFPFLPLRLSERESERKRERGT